MTSIDNEKLVTLLTAWDNMDSATQSVLTSLPDQMSERSENLEKCRLAMRKAVQDFVYRLPGKEDQ